MKKIIIITSIFFSYIHGMELSSSSIVFSGTTINVKTGSIFEANNRVDLIVINKHHQQQLVEFVTDYYKNQPISIHYLNRNQSTPANTKYTYTLIQHKPLIPQKFYYTMLIPDHTNPAITKISAKQAIEEITEYFVWTLKKSYIKIGVEKKEKTIALTPLNSKSGFNKDHITMGTATGIFTFLNEYPYVFDYIELIVQDPQDVGTYTDLFMNIQETLMDNS